MNDYGFYKVNLRGGDVVRDYYKALGGEYVIPINSSNTFRSGQISDENFDNEIRERGLNFSEGTVCFLVKDKFTGKFMWQFDRELNDYVLKFDMGDKRMMERYVDPAGKDNVTFGRILFQQRQFLDFVDELKKDKSQKFKNYFLFPKIFGNYPFLTYTKDESYPPNLSLLKQYYNGKFKELDRYDKEYIYDYTTNKIYAKIIPFICPNDFAPEMELVLPHRVKIFHNGIWQKCDIKYHIKGCGYITKSLLINPKKNKDYTIPVKTGTGCLARIFKGFKTDDTYVWAGFHHGDFLRNGGYEARFFKDEIDDIKNLAKNIKANFINVEFLKGWSAHAPSYKVDFKEGLENIFLKMASFYEDAIVDDHEIWLASCDPKFFQLEYLEDYDVGALLRGGYDAWGGELQMWLYVPDMIEKNGRTYDNKIKDDGRKWFFKHYVRGDRFGYPAKWDINFICTKKDGREEIMKW